jgi:hypothetical protein
MILYIQITIGCSDQKVPTNNPFKTSTLNGGEEAGHQAGHQAGSQAGHQAGSQGGHQGGHQGGYQGGSQGGSQGSSQGGSQVIDFSNIQIQLPEPKLKKLSQTRYCNAVAQLLGPDILCPTIESEETYLYGFSTISATELTISPTLFETYEQASSQIIADFLSKRNLDQLLGCSASVFDENCLRTFIQKFGKIAFRRSLTAEEQQKYFDLFLNLKNILGMEGVWLDWLRSFLLAPDFLYQVEFLDPNLTQADDPNLPNGHLRYQQISLANRLSFLLLDSPPDETLIDLAEQGRLNQAEIIQQARRLLENPLSKKAIIKYFEEALQLRKLYKMEKDPNLFPLYSPELISAMYQEVLFSLEHVIFKENLDIRQLLSIKKIWINPLLSMLYQVPLPDPNQSDFQAVDLPPLHPRGGFLATAAFLASQAHRTVTSPTHRGKFIQTQLRCIDVPPPPPGINTSLDAQEDPNTPRTTKQKLEQHREDPTCRGCHQIMDPMGLSLENYDALGMWRTTENGLAIDAHGEFNRQTFLGHLGLSQMLAQDENIAKCFARQFYRYANMRLETEGELELIDDFENRFIEQAQSRWLKLVEMMVTHPSFLYATPSQNQP